MLRPGAKRTFTLIIARSGTTFLEFSVHTCVGTPARRAARAMRGMGTRNPRYSGVSDSTSYFGFGGVMPRNATGMRSAA